MKSTCQNFWRAAQFNASALYRTEDEANDTAINSLIKYLQVDKKTEKLVKKLKERLSGNLQLDLFAGFAF